MFQRAYLVTAFAAALCLVTVSPAGAGWVLQFEDDFSDVNSDGVADGWVVGDDPYHEPDIPFNIPVLEGSGGDYVVRGVGSGGTEPVNSWLWHPLPLTDVGAVKFEFRAMTSGYSPNNVNIGLLDGMDYYNGHVWATDDVHWIKKIESDYLNLEIDDYEDHNEWHVYAWWRDHDGWWSFSVDGEVLEGYNFDHYYQDMQLTSFDKVALDPVRDGSYIDWVKVYTPEPATLSLLALGGMCVTRRRR